MFSNPKDNPPEAKTKLQEPTIPSNLANPPVKPQPQSSLANNKSDLVTSVEKISGIISPYFIVLVGLYLYNDDFWFSFLLGTILIITGVVSILKISGEDVDKFFTWLKKVLGYDNEENE